MEAQIKSADGRMIFKLEGDTVKTLFKAIAGVQEVFTRETHCGCCKSHDIHFRVRTIDENDFYELACGDCGARFEFGQNKKGGGLFPKRKDENGKPLANGGWGKYVAPTVMAAPPQTSTTRAARSTRVS